MNKFHCPSFGSDHLGWLLAGMLLSAMAGPAAGANFNPPWSHFNHSSTDVNGLKSRFPSDTFSYTGAASAPSKMYLKITGSGVSPGDYVHIQASGRIQVNGGAAGPFDAVGVFTDGILIRNWNGYTNRFAQGTPLPEPSNILKVAAVPVPPDAATQPTNAVTANTGNYGGTANQAQIADFSLGRSDGPGVIVRVPATSTGNVYLFKSVNESSGFSRITDVDASIAFGKVDPNVGRPQFYFTDNVLPEGFLGGLRVRRQYATQFPVKVKYTVMVSSTDPNAANTTTAGADFFNPERNGTLVFAPGETEKLTDTVHIHTDGVYEGNETFTLKLSVDPEDNPNEAYVAGNGDFAVTVTDNDTPPNIYFPPQRDANSGSFAGSTHNEPGLETPINVPIQLSRPSKFWTAVWYNYDPADVGTAIAGIPATDGPDFVYNNIPNDRYIVIPAGQTTGSIPIYLRGDAVYEGMEIIVLHLGVDGSRGYTDLSWTPAANEISGRYVISIVDSLSAPTASITLESPGDASRPEPGNGTGSQIRRVRVSLSSPSTFPTTIPLHFSGTAGRGSDFTVPVDFVTIPAGSTSATFDLTILDDSLPEFEEVVLLTLGTGSGFLISPTNHRAQTSILDNDGGELMNQVAPTAVRSAGNSAITMTLDSTMTVANWRIKGETLWRLSGTTATGLAAGYHEIEFRSFDGMVRPQPMIVQVSAGQTWMPAANGRPYYIMQDQTPPGTSITVNLSIPNGGWKLEGEAAWRASGDAGKATGFPRGVYRIFFKPVAGYALPAELSLSFSASPVKMISKTYVAQPTAPAWPPSAPVADSLINDNPADSSVFVGRISSSSGYATGTAAQTHTVLTCAHVLFDDNTLSFASGVRWHHQAQKGFYQPAAETSEELTGALHPSTGARVYDSGIIPRGWLVLGGYTTKRLEYLQGGGAPGFATQESQELDVGAVFFGHAVARGAKAGMLVRGATEAAGRWLQAGDATSQVRKRMMGYPYEGVQHDQLGRLFSRDFSVENGNYSSISVTPSEGHLFHSNNIVARGGMSGAPVFIERSAGVWNVAAIYLGANAGSNYGVLREIGADVGDLITQANGRAGDGNTTGGGSHFVSSADLEDQDLNTGRVVIRSNVVGANWRLLGGQSYRLCRNEFTAGDPLELPPDQLVPVEFGEVPNWTKPEIMLVEADPEAEVEYQANYVPRNYLAIQAQLVASGATAAQQAAAADFDGDGTSNFLEWAFNLDPTRRDAATLVPSTGTAGMPYVRMVGLGSSRWLRVEFVRMKNNPALSYEVQFANGLDPGDWSAAAGTVIAVSDIDANWQRVVVEDSQEVRPKRFARVKVVNN